MDLTQAGAFIDKNGVPVFLVVVFVLFFIWKIWPYLMKRFQQDGERESTLLKRVFDVTDAQIKQTGEVSKNMAEGNILLGALSNHTAQGMENIVKRLEITEARTDERHIVNVQNMARMMQQWDDIHAALNRAILQNAGDIRNSAQKLESENRNVKKNKLQPVTG